MSESIKILKEPSKENPFVILYKPSGLPSAPLKEGDECALKEAAVFFPEILQVNASGERTGRKQIEHGLIHRIDTLTRGLLLIATTEQSFHSLLQSQREGKFSKGYRAECRFIKECPDLLGGFPKFAQKPESVLTCMNKCTITSGFRNFGPKGARVRPVAGNSYCTQVSLTQKSTGLFTAECTIAKGYRHQVRCHLAWAGLPILGDPLYNPRFTDGEEFEFCAHSLRFPHPLTGEICEFSLETYGLF